MWGGGGEAGRTSARSRRISGSVSRSTTTSPPARSKAATSTSSNRTVCCAAGGAVGGGSLEGGDLDIMEGDCVLIGWEGVEGRSQEQGALQLKRWFEKEGWEVR